MAINVGDKLPEATFKMIGPDGAPKDATTAELFGGKKVALFAVPGAFTPACTKQHLPGFAANDMALKNKGLQAIYCTAVNDIFVMDAWGKAVGSDGKVTMIADGSADFAKKCGLEMDLTARGMGVRSKRYSMVIDNGVVSVLNVEEQPKVDKSSAETLLSCKF
jgi:peroxiredoxin